MQTNTNAIHFDPAFHAAPQSAYPSRLLAKAREVLSVHRQRNQLAVLSDHQLADIGTARDEARIEAARPFWDLPTAQGIR